MPTPAPVTTTAAFAGSPRSSLPLTINIAGLALEDFGDSLELLRGRE